ncbi:SDR family oxidoreductase [Streptomyces abyssomicinicus]|uniref:SDR family oxidoreductase n=1 Tax=Streptomyces abyssomicinicus TaxID=574929 RepID=UPI0012507CE8|nr:SDR family NAD(P)-dependent oxidoreductase [Streptomyces abyssomicinicus]
MANVEFDFGGRTVVVTGAARGVGLAIAGRFAAAGAQVVMADLDEAAVREAAGTIGAFGIAADVSDTADAEAIVEAALRRTGRVDVVVNNAGILRDGVVWKLSDDDWDQVLAVHTGGTFKLTRAVVPHMRARGTGRIINVTSYSGLRGNIGQSNYGAAKAAIIGFTKATAKELAGFGITVNAISPNAETRMIAGVPPEKREQLLAQIPLKRFADPAEMASAVAFLASDEASYITGVVLPVDGGIAI